MTAKKYPSKWYRVEQRGCTPNGTGCLHLGWPIERQDLSPTKTDTRHVVPEPVLRYCLDNQIYSWDAMRYGKPNQWHADGRRTKRSKKIRVFGATKREAMQNLCAELKVRLP